MSDSVLERNRDPEFMTPKSILVAGASGGILLKNHAIELGYRRQRFVIVGLQPSTTDTGLSAPFKQNVPEDQLQSPEYTASQLAQVMERLRLRDSGKLYDFLGHSFVP